MEQEVKDTACNAANAICDVLRYLGDVTYAVLPRDLAHDLGKLEKSILGTVRSTLDREIEWIDDRVAGGDKLREEWKSRCQPAGSSEGVGA